MDIADIYNSIRAESANDEDDQVSDAQLNTWLTIEYRKLHKRLSARFPSLYTGTSATTTLVTDQQTITKPSNLAKIVHVERLEGSTWFALPKASKVAPELDAYIGWYEQGSTIVITPAASAPGSYRIKFVIAPASQFPASDIPTGFEDIIFQKVIAKLQNRIGGDPSPHLDEADRTWKEQVRAQQNRLGGDPEPGFVSGFGSGSDDFEGFSSDG